MKRAGVLESYNDVRHIYEEGAFDHQPPPYEIYPFICSQCSGMGTKYHKTQEGLDLHTLLFHNHQWDERLKVLAPHLFTEPDHHRQIAGIEVGQSGDPQVEEAPPDAALLSFDSNLLDDQDATAQSPVGDSNQLPKVQIQRRPQRAAALNRKPLQNFHFASSNQGPPDAALLSDVSEFESVDSEDDPWDDTPKVTKRANRR